MTEISSAQELKAQRKAEKDTKQEARIKALIQYRPPATPVIRPHIYTLKTLDGFITVDDEDRMVWGSGQSGSLVGATATVDTAGALDKRITGTRLVLVGVFALAWKKKKNNRELYLLIEGADYSMVVRVDPTKSFDARRFAAGINTIGKGGKGTSSMLPTPSAKEAKKAKEKTRREGLTSEQRAREDKTAYRWINCYRAHLDTCHLGSCFLDGALSRSLAGVLDHALANVDSLSLEIGIS